MCETVPYCVGRWLPSDQKILNNWLKALIEEVDGAEVVETVAQIEAAYRRKPLHPAVQELKDFIENDAEINMFFHQMFDQVPNRPPFNQDPTGKPQVRNYHQMLRLINAILTKAPEYSSSDLVGLPINAILSWSKATIGGFAAFINARVNYHFKKILHEWAVFLQSKDSCYVLNSDPRRGWFGKDAMKEMPNFNKEFKCDPKKPHHGFTSWDDFFTREFRDGVRPIEAPNDDAVIVNACESAPYRLATGVKRRDKFWIKSQPYALQFMLANDPLFEKFVGGTIYQAFLSALSYHRWHSPVSGKVIKTHVQDGSYYSETLAEGFDPTGPRESQAYITEVATRAMIYIEADNPKIGLMCFLAVGMSEVSTCDITVYEGQRIKKGQQTGTFHFGGSTHCLIFQPGVNLEFDLRGQKPGLDTKNINVNSKIATVK